jgi:hypothetical protein
VPPTARGKGLEVNRKGGVALELGTKAKSNKGRKNNVHGSRASHVPEKAGE